MPKKKRFSPNKKSMLNIVPFCPISIAYSCINKDYEFFVINNKKEKTL